VSQVSSTKKLLSASAFMAAGTMISRVLGVVRVMMVAFILGNGTRQADMLNIATMVPNALYILLAGGALNTVLVPQIVRAIKNDDDGGEAYTNRIMTAFMIAVTAVAIIITAAAPLVTQLYTSADWRVEELSSQYAAMVALTYLTLPQIFFYGAFFLFGQILNARDKFGPMMWAPITNNVISILTMGVYFVVWGNGDDHSQAFTTAQILVLGIGSTLGIAAQLITLLPFIRRVGFKLRPRFDLKGTGLGKTFSLTKWTFGFVAVNQVALMLVNQLATSATATGHGAGATVYSNAHLLWILPHSLITVSLATAMLPNASRLAASGDSAGVAQEFTKTIRLSLIAIVPATVAFMSLSVPMAMLLFGHGTGSEDASWIAWTLMGFAIGLIPYTVQFVCLRTFYALEDTRTPFMLQIIIAGTNMLGAWLLVWVVTDPGWVAAALATAFSLAYLIGVFFSWQALKKRIPDLDGSQLVLHIVRLLLGSSIGGVAAYFLTDPIINLIPSAVVGDIVALIVGGVLILASYLLIAKALHVRELANLGELVRTRFGRRGTGDSASEEDANELSAREQLFDDQLPTLIQPAIVDESPRRGADDVPDFDPPTVIRTRPAMTTHTFEGTDAGPATAPMAAVTEPAPPADDEGFDLDSVFRPAEEPEPEAEATQRIATVGTLLQTRYELEELLTTRLGTESWRAHDQVLSRDVVVHVVAPGDARITSLLAAARKGAAATDSRFLRVLDADEIVDPTAGIGAYVVAEFAPGRTLGELLRGGPLSAIEAAFVARELGDALVGVHAQGLFHEQINPESVIITTVGAVRLVGFGIDATLAADERPVSWSDRESADVVGLGRLLYAMLVSHWPGDDEFGLPAAPIIAGETAPAHTVQVGVSPALDRICSATITERGAAGERRITTAAQFVTALVQVLGSADASADLEARVRSWAPATPLWTASSGQRPDLALSLAPGGSAATRSGPAPGGPTAGRGGAVGAAGVAGAALGASRGAGEAPGSSSGDGAGAVGSARNATDDGFPGGSAGQLSRLDRLAAGSDEAVGQDPSGGDAGTAARREPESRRGLWIVLILATAALVISLIVVGMNSIRDNAADPAASVSAGGTASAEQSGVPEPIAIASARDFDPEADGGNGEENPGGVAAVIDGDPATSWQTMRYLNRPNLGGLKPGVGIVLDLGEEQQVASVDLQLTGGTTTVELRVPNGSEASMRTSANWNVVATDKVKGSGTIELDEPVSTRYLLVYFTNLPEVDGGYRAEVNEITVR